MSLERALALGQRVIIITGESFIPNVIKETSKLSASEKKRVVIIGEPAAKNTAPAVACAVVYSLYGIDRKNNKKRDMLVLTSDHIIKPFNVFKADAGLAAAAEKKLVVFGIPVQRPETGYGYIEIKNSKSKSENGIFTVNAFHEKPDEKTAKKYCSSGKYFWNSGMFAFDTCFMEEMFLSLEPDIYKCFIKLKEPKPDDYTILKGVKILTSWKGLKTAYSKVKNISFDYAVAEKCESTAMVRAGFDWIDIGNWDEYIKICPAGVSQVFGSSAVNCHVDSDIPAALAGVEDLIVIIRMGKNGGPASALITKKGQTQKVRGIIDEIKAAGRQDLL